MTMKTYIRNEFSGRGFSRFDEIPEEMFDYLPERLDRDEDEDFLITAEANDLGFMF